MKVFTIRYSVTYETVMLADNAADAAVKVQAMAGGSPTKIMAVWDTEDLPPEVNSISWAERVFKKRWK